MMGRFNRAFACVAMAATMASTGARAAEPEIQPLVLNPSSKWGLTRSAERCSLAREFGQGDQTILMQLDSYGSFSGVKLIVSGKQIAIPKSNKVAMRLQPGEQTEELDALLLGEANGAPVFSIPVVYEPASIRTDPAGEKVTGKELRAARKAWEPQRQAYEENATVIDFQMGQQRIVFETGDMHAPLNAMRDCVALLYKDWGADPEVERNLSSTAEVNPDVMWRIHENVSTNALAPEQIFDVHFRINVSAEGKPSGCVIQSLGVPKFIKTGICRTLTGKMSPALDANGQPVPSILISRIIWDLRQ